MRRLVTFAIIILTILYQPQVVDALKITFDEQGPATTLFDQTKAIRDEYASLHFRGPGDKDGGAILNISSTPTPAHSGNNALVFDDRSSLATLSDGGKPIWPETITFDNLWANVTIYVASMGMDMDHFTLIAYDDKGDQVATGHVDTKVWAALSVSWAGGIKSVLLSMDKKENDVFAADDLELTTPVTPTPEPGTLLLLGFGLMGLARLATRRK